MDKRKIKIRAEYLTKKFELLSTKDSKSKAKSILGANKQNQQDFWALRNVSFEIRDGECIGVIGLNGAGKSTLSNIISGQIAQTTGSVMINGDVSIIAANAGMQNNLSGRENIKLKGLMMGMTNKEIKEKMEDIIDFSELGLFIDQPVKTYSSGMKAKLGFSIMVHQDPDIMIIDEGLSTGDKTFVDKSQKKMFEFREKGKTILLVSHDMRIIRDWCDKVIWLHYGEVKAYGATNEVAPKYEEFVQWFKKLDRNQQEEHKKNWYQEQLDYSVEALKKEILESQKTKSRHSKDKVEKRLKKQKDSHKLSFASKLAVFCCAFLFLLISLVSMSDVTLGYAVQHPRTFLTKHLFKATNPTALAAENSKSSQKSSVKPSQSASRSTSQTKSSQKSSSTTQSSSSITPPSSSSTTEVTKTHTVVAGESVSLIAETYGVTIADIQAVNPDVDLSIINPGQVINLPATATEQTTTTDGGNG